MHFHPVDADAGKTGDHTHDAGAPNTAVVMEPGLVDTGATHARFDGYITCATHAWAQCVNACTARAAESRRKGLGVDGRVAFAAYVGGKGMRRAEQGGQQRSGGKTGPPGAHGVAPGTGVGTALESAATGSA